MRRKSNQGMTIPELITAVAVMGVISAMGIPSFQKLIERNRLKQAAESFKSDVLLARTEAIKRSQNIFVSRTTGNAGAWCYGLRTSTACDCAETSVAASDYCNVKRVSGADFGQINMETAGVNNNQFDFRRGTIGANGVTFSTNNYSARVIFSNAGRVRLCTPAGTVGLPDFPDC
jgi:type IV fimbrial biogenesis protein FimT